MLPIPGRAETLPGATRAVDAPEAAVEPIVADIRTEALPVTPPGLAVSAPVPMRPPVR